MENIAEKIVELRKKAGISQEELGLEVGVSRQTINKWESGAVFPNLQKLKLLCDYFGVKSDYFLYDDTQENGEAAISSTETQVEYVSRKRPNYFLILTILFSTILFTVGIILSFIIGFAFFTPDLGFTSVSVHEVQKNGLIAVISVTSIAFIGLISLITYSLVKRHKEKKRKTK